MYWSCKRTKSRNAMLNFIVGNRGAGKTFGYLDFCVERWLKTRRTKKPEMFMYARRTKEELKPLAISRPGKLFEKLSRVKYRDHKFKADSGNLYIDDEICGYAVAVTEMPGLKSVDYPLVRYFALDEFIIDRGLVGQHYIRGEEEPQILLDFYQTVDRDEDRLTMFFLANAITENNPYFNFFNLRMPPPTKIRLFGDDQEILVDNVADPELIAKKQGTRFGKMIEGTKYGEYSISNKMLRDSETFVAHKPPTCAYKCTLIYLSKELGVWYDTRNGVYYISFDVERDNPIRYAVTDDDHRPNIMLMKGTKKSPYLVNLLTAYDMGRVYYENKKIANWFREIVRII